MKKILGILFLLMLITSTKFAIAQNWTSFTNTDDIRGISFDSKGNEWFATTGGIKKFDGSNWTKYTNTNSGLHLSQVTSIAVDKQDRVWAVNLVELNQNESHNTKIYVSVSGSDTSRNGFYSDPFRNIQTAVNYALDNDTIIVLEGRYKERVHIKNKNITLTSTYSDKNDTTKILNTIIDAEYAGRALVLEGFNGKVNGITISKGYSNYAPGLWVFSSNTPEVRNCYIQDNRADGDITIHGVCFEASNGVLEEVVVRRNYGRKHTVQIGGQSKFRNSFVYANTAWEESNVVVSTAVTLENLVIADNLGGGLKIWPGANNATINHLTITGNTNYGLWVWGLNTNTNTVGRVSNSIIWGNKGDNIKLTQSAAPSQSILYIDYSIVQGGKDAIVTDKYNILNYGAGNLSWDPQLDALNGYRLKDISPAIGAAKTPISIGGGTNISPVDDILGNNRPSPIGSNPDMGAFESVLSVPGGEANKLELKLNIPDTIVCAGDRILLTGITNRPVRYRWSTGDTTASIYTLKDSSKVYYLEVTDGTLFARDSVSIHIAQNVFNPFAIITESISSTSIVLDAGSGFTDFLWNDGATTQTKLITQNGWYKVEARTSYGCKVTDSTYVTFYHNSKINVSLSGNDYGSIGLLEHPFKSIQTAVNYAISGDTIIVQRGRYRENILVRGKNIFITSTNNNISDSTSILETIIDGGGITNAVILDNFNGIFQGFTIENGYSNYGAGLKVLSSNSPIVRNCYIQNNIGNGDITAHGIDFAATHGLLENVVVRRNYGRKHTVQIGGQSKFRNSFVYANTAWEESNVVVSSAVTLENLVIADNLGGGLKIWPGANNATINHLTITGNTNYGLWVWGLNTNINTVGRISNSIIWGNKGDNVKLTQSAAPSQSILYIDYSIVQGGKDAITTDSYNILNYGAGNISSDPQLDALNGYRLNDISPAIGAGKTPLLIGGLTNISPIDEIRGGVRPFPVGSNPDIGAFESILSLPANMNLETPTISASGNTTFCEGGSVVLTSSASSGNQWYKDGTLITSATGNSYTATQSGSYSVKVTSNGLESEMSKSINVVVYALPERPVVSSGGVTKYFTGSSVELSSSSQSGNQWYNEGKKIEGATSSIYSATQSGVYSVQVTDEVGCLSMMSTLVSLVKLKISQRDTTICKGTSLTLSIDSTSILSPTGSLPSSLRTGLIAYFPFNGNANDESGNGNNGIINGPQSTVDRFGNFGAAYKFNGINDHIVVNNSNSLNSGSISISGWINMSSLPSGNCCTNGTFGIVTKWRQSVNCGSSSDTYGMVVDNISGTPRLITGTSIYPGGTFFSPSPIDSNKWIHTVFVHDANNGGRLYINGNLVSSNNSIGAICSSTNNVILGADNYLDLYLWRFFKGSLDDIAIWNRPITSQEVAQLYTVESNVSWSNGSNSNTITVTPTQTTKYYVTVSDGITSCQDSVTVYVNNEIPVISTSGALTFCEGDSVTLTSSNAESYFWYKDGAAFSNDNSITVKESGLYNLYVKDINNCLSEPSPTKTISVNALPVIPVISADGATEFCSGGSVILSADVSSSYQWYKDGLAISGAISRTFSITNSGVYSVVVKNENGCESLSSSSTIVTVNPIPSTPTISAGGATTFCAGGSVILTSSSATGNQWYVGGSAINTNGTGQTYTATTSGTYTVKVTTTGCESSSSLGTTVTVNPIPSTPTISAGGATIFCVGGSVILTSSSATGNQWYLDGNSITTNGTGQTYTATTSGTYTVKVTTTGCESPSSLGTTVTVNPNPVSSFTVNNNSQSLTGNSFVFTNTSTGGATYLWNFGNGATATTQNATYSYAATGTYNVELKVTSLTGCMNSSIQSITVTNPIAKSNLYPNTVTCQSYLTGAANLSNLCYTVSKGKVAAITPETFFYYATIVAPSTSFTMDVVQTVSISAYKLFAVQSGSAKLLNNTCGTFISGNSPSSGQSQFKVTGAVVGRTYILSMVYETKNSIVATSSNSEVPVYTFTAKVGTSTLPNTTSSISMYPNNCLSIPTSSLPTLGGIAGSSAGKEVTAIEKKIEINAYPNPSNDVFDIVVKGSDSNTPGYLTVYNMLGQVMEIRNGIKPGDRIKLGRNYVNGTYLIEYLQNGMRVHKKLIKQ